VCRSETPQRSQNGTPPDARVAALAAEQHGVVSTHDLRACGLSGTAVTRRVRHGRLHRLHRGVYAVGHPATTRQARFMAAVLACGIRACLSHFAAAALWGFLRWEDRLPDVTVAGCQRHIDGVRVHRSRALLQRDVLRHESIPVTSPARTLLDLAAVLPRRALRRAARQAQVDRRVSVRQLLEIADRCNGHPGAARLRAAVADGPAPTRSELEDILLDLLDAAGVQRPEINVMLHLDGEAIVPDYLWRDRRLAIEADSATWHDHKLVREHDADKQAILEAHGYRVMRVSYRQTMARPQQTLARIRAALAAC